MRAGALRARSDGLSSARMRQDVTCARKMQAARFNGRLASNAAMSHADLKKHCPLDDASERLITTAMEQLALSARAHDKIIKVARTIADIEGVGAIAAPHLAEAIQYRSLDRSYWA